MKTRNSQLEQIVEAPISVAGEIVRPTPKLMAAQLTRPRIACPARLRGWSFTHHARDAVDGRWFDPHDVISVCESPDISSTAYDYGPGRFRYLRGRLVVIAVPETRLIITVLLRSYDTWNNDDARKAA